jgi:signal peptidase
MTATAFPTPRNVTKVAFRGLLRICTWTLVGAAVLLFIGLGLGPRTGLYRTMTVLSGSMSPTFAAGDAVVVTPEPVSAIRVGQVVVYSIPIGDRHVEAHRVISVHRDSTGTLIKTKGDANTAADPWTARLRGDRIWVVRSVIPKLGSATILLRDPRLHALLLFAAPLLLVASGLTRIWRRSSDATCV